MSRTLAHMVSGRVLARNAVFNIGGLTAPMVAAIVTIPILISGVGAERFGFITVAWVVIGYFSLFDFGLGRALTKLVAERLGNGRDEEVGSLTWTALLLMTGLGVAGAVLLVALTHWLVQSALKIPDELRGEAVVSFYLLAFSLPFVITTAALRGVLEANQSFGLVNALRVPMGLFNYIGPVLVLPFSRSLVPIIAVLAAGRVIGFLAHFLVCLRVLPVLRENISFSREQVRPLIHIGGWMTVSNIVSPLMTYIDRFLISAFISMAAVAYYVTPYEVITKFLVLPSALVGVLFPAFASSYLTDHSRTAQLFDRGIRAVFLCMFPITLVVVALAEEGLTLWLGREFASNSTHVLQWLAVGVFINSLGQVASAVFHGVGRSDLTGKLHLIELPIYVAMILYLAQARGIEGVAIAWVLRVTLDTALLLVGTTYLLPGSAQHLRKSMSMVILALATVGLTAVSADLALKIGVLIGVLTMFGLVGWYRILEPSERALLGRS